MYEGEREYKPGRKLYWASPGSDRRRPVVIHLHGGGWIIGGPSLAEARGIVSAIQCVGVSVQYTLANGTVPGSRWPAAMRDVADAISYVRRNAPWLGADPDRVFVMGGSAGGHLAMMAALTSGQPLRGVVSHAGPSDIMLLHDQTIADEALFRAVFGPLPDAADVYRSASPVRWVRPGLPPFLLVHGGLDRMVPPVHSRVMAQELKRFGCDVTLIEYPFRGHHIGSYTPARDFTWDWVRSMSD